jgi:hypothetical protein
MLLRTPQSITSEHEELHAKLEAIIAAGGATGEAAKGVDCALQPHFQKEEEYALPPLGLLPVLASGKATPEMTDAAEMASKLRANLGRMLQEHKEIAVALNVLTDRAKQEGRTEAIRFAEKLMLHAQMEEEVLYPASILIGECLKTKRQ